ncbi:MAG: hypothetical protein HZC02_00785 [Candidatus Levybacteria bacterium]|nr:hypothetical protein [Candidatus Levybacteria bacterium]
MLSDDTATRRWVVDHELKARAMEIRLEHAPAFAISDQDAWNTSIQDEGRVFRDFVERWARLIQAEIQKGYHLKDVAYQLMIEADIDGVAGVHFDKAVGVLIDCWKYGDELSLWYNMTTQLG